MSHVKQINGVTFIGTSLPKTDAYCAPERNCWKIIAQQIGKHFSGQKNLLISTTWFGPKFDNFSGWQGLMQLVQEKQSFDNVFFLTTVDPCYLNATELQQVKNLLNAMRVYHLGNYDGPGQFNFFAIEMAKNFRNYTNDEILLEHINYLFVNYNRKPKPHRVAFVRKLIDQNLDKLGILTLGTDHTNSLYLTLGEKQADYIGSQVTQFGLPMDFYSLHRLDIWKTTFLYINAATEFDPINDLFCQQDTFKPMLGLRPFVINGVQKTYRWLRLHGFKTFNNYWEHIDIENGDVHETIIELIKFLKSQSSSDLLSMYTDMLPDLQYNKQRFFEFAREQQHKVENLFV